MRHPIALFLVMLSANAADTVQPNATPTAPGSASAFGGIEIGSKGVKARLFSFSGSGENRTVKEHYSKSINTSLVSSMASGKFSDNGMQEVVRAVTQLSGELRSAAEKEKLPALELFTVASSAVAKGTNNKDLLAAVKKASGLDPVLIDAKTENLDGLISAVPEPRRDESLLIDTGSGNTTAGCLVDSDYKSAEIPYGSVSLRNTSIDSSDYEVALKGVLDAMVRPAYKKETLNKPCLANRGRIYWIGGAAWAAATFIHPERSTNAYVELTRREIDEFLVKLKNGTWNAQQPRIAFAKETPDSVRRTVTNAALKDWKGVQNVFVREDVYAGVSLFRSLLDVSNPNARILFVRNGNFLYGYALSRYIEGKTQEPAQPKQVSQTAAPQAAPVAAAPARQ
jgi:hypothetical protein